MWKSGWADINPIKLAVNSGNYSIVPSVISFDDTASIVMIYLGTTIHDTPVMYPIWGIIQFGTQSAHVRYQYWHGLL